MEIVCTCAACYRRVRRAARGDDQIHAIFEQRRRDHENDQQHKREIEQRGDVDFAKRGKIVALRIAPHISALALGAVGSR